MKKKKKDSRFLSVHLMIIAALFLLTMWVLDQLNPQMGFLGNGVSKWVLFVLLILCLINGGRFTWMQYNLLLNAKPEDEP